MDLIKKMEQLGANKSQLTSNTLALAVRAIAEDENVIPDTVRLDIVTLSSNIERASARLVDYQNRINRTIESAEATCEHIEQRAKTATENYEAAKRREESVITDKDLSEAVKAYRAVLQATTDVLGTLDKETQIAAISAGSYIAWRGIMGGKFKDDSAKTGFKKGWEPI